MEKNIEAIRQHLKDIHDIDGVINKLIATKCESIIARLDTIDPYYEQGIHLDIESGCLASMLISADDIDEFVGIPEIKGLTMEDFLSRGLTDTEYYVQNGMVYKTLGEFSYYAQREHEETYAHANDKEETYAHHYTNEEAVNAYFDKRDKETGNYAPRILEDKHGDISLLNKREA